MKKIIKSLLPFLLFMSPAIFIGALVGAYPGFKMYEYTWKNANFCTTCHVHDYANVGWQNSIHGEKTTCHDCHHQPLRAYLKETYIMLTKNPKFPEDLHHTPYVKKDLCAACHVSDAADKSTITGPMEFEDIQKIPKVDLSYLHKTHLAKETEFTLLNSHQLSESERAAQPIPPKELPRDKAEKRPITCADCHGGPLNRGHNFSSVDATCVRCHENAHQTKVGKTYGCRSCHFSGFMIPVWDKKSKDWDKKPNN